MEGQDSRRVILSQVCIIIIVKVMYVIINLDVSCVCETLEVLRNSWNVFVLSNASWNLIVLIIIQYNNNNS